MINKNMASLLLGSLSVVLVINLYLNYETIQTLNQDISNKKMRSLNFSNTDIAFLNYWGRFKKNDSTLMITNTKSLSTNIETLYRFLKKTPINIIKIQLKMDHDRSIITLHYAQ